MARSESREAEGSKGKKRAVADRSLETTPVKAGKSWVPNEEDPCEACQWRGLVCEAPK